MKRLALGALLVVGCARGVVEQPPGPGDVDAAPPADAPPPPRPDAPPADRAPERPLPRDTAPAEVPVGCGVANIVTRSFFDGIFPAAGRNSVFTYEGFIAAAATYPDFVGSGDGEACRKEAAAFLANVSHETGNLRYAEQIAKDHYCQPSGSCPCDGAATDQSKWYYGRGALQLSWNYNYCSAGSALGADLASNPSLVSTSPELAWKTALWFWMRGGVGNSCHSAMQPGGGGFGATIRIINGGIECGKGGYGAVQGVTNRVDRYLEYARRLGIANPGTAQMNGC
jgi:predicted chitinase